MEPEWIIKKVPFIMMGEGYEIYHNEEKCKLGLALRGISWVTGSNHCIICKKVPPDYIIFQRDLMNGK